MRRHFLTCHWGKSGKTETNDDPRARKPAYDKIHCLTYER
ncbi:hypothetical protein SELSPUOL_01126 [Selenomonas sputigena ATCC 35185]|uniref:Uncharacterized protein n=1 Tax=Selenomonas sputigena (strain ATCC 35185 / DSM 20758 / CCUG 44933 / VPI D19B-28) TaxID=546271 RepID=C9LUJ0_SELS3|nr:hypothetical protein SELSPUOL_01126 [Selenomonas sputigena ATCC 35185]